MACKVDQTISPWQRTLGTLGVTTWFAYLFLLYALTAAYMTGGNSLCELVCNY